ncbi:MAG TPA: HD-GYP domain-containing protein [Actinomycetota bacterium]|nr:HD-GYP domain-containing protein [Actinomycetota bacterium]
MVEKRIPDEEPTTPPWDLSEQLTIFAEELGMLYRLEKEKSTSLAELVQRLEEAQESFALAFALVVEGRDPDTRAHLARTTRWASAVSREIGLPNLRELRLGFLLHDIGKWQVPREVIQKAGPLDDDEWKIMRMHPVAGVQMISDVKILEPAFDVIRYHHERWDGTGYPYGKAGDEIPVAARVFAIADVFDALTSDRPYRTRSFTLDEAVDIVRAGSGTHFDPRLVETFLDVVLGLEQGRG